MPDTERTAAHGSDRRLIPVDVIGSTCEKIEEAREEAREGHPFLANQTRQQDGEAGGRRADGDVEGVAEIVAVAPVDGAG